MGREGRPGLSQGVSRLAWVWAAGGSCGTGLQRGWLGSDAVLAANPHVDSATLPPLDKCVQLISRVSTGPISPPLFSSPEDGNYQGTRELPCLLPLGPSGKPQEKVTAGRAPTYRALSALLSPSNRSFCRTQLCTAARTPQGPPCEGHALVPVRSDTG